MHIYYAGEDVVTKEVAKRLIHHSATQAHIDDYTLEEISPRLSGRRALEKIAPMLQLAEVSPVVAVFDADTNCILQLLSHYAPQGWQRPYGAINFAIDEAESWLMADRRGLSKFLGIKTSQIPVKGLAQAEISDAIPYKTSLYILNELVPHSAKKRIHDALFCPIPWKKPSTYNNVWPSFIQTRWNIERAMRNSLSLRRTVDRIDRVFVRWKAQE